MSWKPTSEETIKKLIDTQYKDLSFKEKKAFNAVKITPKQVKIERFDNLEDVWIIAEAKGKYIFFEDVEETFCITTMNEDNSLNKKYDDFGFYDFIGTILELIKQDKTTP